MSLTLTGLEIGQFDLALAIADVALVFWYFSLHFAIGYYLAKLLYKVF